MTASLRCLGALLIGCLLASHAPAQDISPEGRRRLQAGLEELTTAAQGLKAAPQRAVQQREDVQVFAKAVEWILRHKEFYKPAYEKDAQQALERGQQRADDYRAGKADWGSTPGRFVLGYRSVVDGSIQPYAVTLPAGFKPDARRKWPLHVVLHGRGGTLNEVSFIRQHEGKEPAEGQDWIQLDVFGRINNAYRWAGETDVFEALQDVQRRYSIDDRKITLWGFSMGGAGAWHLGLHHPSQWSSVGAGAGFVDFYRYQKRSDPLPPWQHKTLRIYDAVDYALNLENVPFITYGGEVDPQLAASLTMQEQAEKQLVALQVLIGPKMGHKFDDESLKKFMAFHARHTKEGRPTFPGQREIRFVTYTPKYNRCEWLTVHELSQMYEAATVESKYGDDGLLQLTTDNVAALSVARGAADRVSLDGGKAQLLEPAADGLLPDVYFVRKGDEWTLLDYDASLRFIDNSELHKRRDLQGPIDDAFMQSFVCVRGTGKPWSQPHHDWAMWTLDRFTAEFDKWMRGQPRVIDDSALTDEVIASSNLVLFGDPGSNSVLAKVVDRLPIEWTREGLTVNGETYDPATHGLALVYPNPLNPRRYVVINSGMTTHEKDFKASNAWLFPKLGDIAVQKFTRDGKGYAEETAWAELFDSRWKLPGKGQ